MFDERMGMLIDYFTALKKLDLIEFDKELFADFSKVYAAASVIKELSEEEDDLTVIVTEPDPSGMIGFSLALFGDFDKVFSNVTVKSCREHLLTMIKAYDIGNFVPTTTSVSTPMMANAINARGAKEIICISFDRKDKISDKVPFMNKVSHIVFLENYLESTKDPNFSKVDFERYLDETIYFQKYEHYFKYF